MSNTAAIRLRRWRRPPARLVYIVTDYAFCLGWIAYVVGVGTLYPQERALSAGLAVLLVMYVVQTRHDFARTLAAWRRGLPVRAVSPIEWAFLAVQVIGALVVGALVIGVLQ